MSSVQRRPKRVLTAEQKYDLWVRMQSGQMAQAAEAGVDRSVIARLRAVARDGAIAALQSSRPGRARRSPAEVSEAAALEPTQPGTFEGTPTGADVAVRDQLIVSQEALLNTYRCLFNVDTQIVPGGCLPYTTGAG